MRDCRLIRLDRDGDLSSRAKAADAYLSGLLLILCFDQRCLRHEKKGMCFHEVS